VVLGQDPGYIRQQTATVECLNLYLDEEQTLTVGRPGNIHDAIGLLAKVLYIAAIDSVHRHASAASNEAYDFVTGHGRAASGQLGHNIRVATHKHAGIVRPRTFR
jgi:hypothetical protein